MWGTVLFFALVTATEPQRMGIAAILVGLRRPMHNLFAFWLGLMTSGMALALAGMFLLRDYLVPFTHLLKSAAHSPLVPPAKIIFGTLALLFAVAIVVRSSARRATPATVSVPVPVPVPVGGPCGFEDNPSGVEGAHSGLELASKRPTVFSRVMKFALGRTSWSTVLDKGSVKLAFFAGLSTSASPLEFWGAVLAILASGAAVGTQMSALLMFLLVGFAIAEIPLVCHLVSPAKTLAVAMRLQGWLRAHQRQIFVFILSVLGVVMVCGGATA
jgi:hypothetical protein